MDQGHKETDKKLKALENRLSREYKNAYNTVKKRADAYFKRFDAEDKEKQKLIKKGELSASDYAQWRFERMAGGQHFCDLCNVLTEDMINADKIAVSIINGHIPEIYADNVNFGTYEIESGANINTSFTLYDKDTVENLMKKDPHVIPQAKIDIPKDERWNRRKLTSALTQGILAGDSIPHIAERLKQVTDMDTRAAIRNARTYTTAAENKGRMDSYERAEEMGINMKKQWVATLDDRTRHTHRLLDGVAIDIDEEFDNGLQFPGDPDGDDEEIYNCRCTLIAKLGDYNFKSNYRNSKLDGISYDDWQNQARSRMETIDKMYYGTGINKEKAKEAFSDWANGAAYDIRFSQQMGRPSDEAKFIEKLIAKSNVYYGDGKTSLYRGIMADKETASIYYKALEDMENGEDVDTIMLDMKGTSSWSYAKDIADDFSKNADKIGGLDSSDFKDSTPIIFNYVPSKNDKVAIDIDEFAGLDQKEVIVSERANFVVSYISINDGVIEVDLDLYDVRSGNGY